MQRASSFTIEFSDINYQRITWRTIENNLRKKFSLNSALASTQKQLLTLAYLPQTNWKVKGYNQTIMTQLCHYVTDHQHNCNKTFQSLTCAYITQVHSLTYTMLFSLGLSSSPPVTTRLNDGTAFLSDK